jgi:hypothetical protein
MTTKKAPAPKRSSKAVHRDLERHDTGPDVRELQHGVGRRAGKLKLPWLAVTDDAEVGPRTEHSANLILFALGVYGPAAKRCRAHHEISEYAQRVLRGTRRRTPLMVALAVKRRRTVRNWRKQYNDRASVQETDAVADLIALIAKGMAYLWGGGHVTPADSGPGDCSWLASREIQHFDPSIPTGTTYTLAVAGVEGFGVELTLMIKNIDGRPDESHVIERWRMPQALVDKYKLGKWVIDHEADGTCVLYSECGGSDNPTAGNGPSFFIPGLEMGLTVESRLAEFDEHRHVKGS